MQHARTFPVSIAARHVKLSAGHLDALFGPGHVLTSLVPLSSDDVACAETVTLRAGTGELTKLRVVGPVARSTIACIGPRDAQRLGLDARARLPQACVLEGPRGSVVLSDGLRVGLRALMLSVDDARTLEVGPGSLVNVHVASERARDLRDLPVRIREGNRSEVLVDMDDANTLDLQPGSTATLT
jgi:propanediol utilization protein